MTFEITSRGGYEATVTVGEGLPVRLGPGGCVTVGDMRLTYVAYGGAGYVAVVGS